MTTLASRWVSALRRRVSLPAGDLLHDVAYRRLFASILIASFGGQITLLALPLTAAVLLHASPTQMGLLTALETLPFVLFSLPSGVWLDRVRKLPIYIAGEATMAMAVLSVPLAWWLDALSMSWLYVVGFVIGSVNTVAGSAAQIVLTQVVPRERLIEAHARNALGSSSAEVAGPGIAGALIKLLGAPVTLLVDACMLLISTLILRGIRVAETLSAQPERRFWRDLKDGVDFVRSHRLLVALALSVGVWQFCQNSALVVQILHATRTLGLSEQAIGLCYVGLGLGTIAGSAYGHRISQRFGPGPTLVIGIGTCAAGWMLAGVLSSGTWGIAAFAAMLVLYGGGAVLIFINFLGLRQAVTPPALLGRMTSTMRWLILIPAGPGALWGGWLGERAGLAWALVFAGAAAALLAMLTWRTAVIRDLRQLPPPPS